MVWKDFGFEVDEGQMGIVFAFGNRYAEDCSAGKRRVEMDDIDLIGGERAPIDSNTVLLPFLRFLFGWTRWYSLGLLLWSN